jgi:hypothetical protein
MATSITKVLKAVKAGEVPVPMLGTYEWQIFINKVLATPTDKEYTLKQVKKLIKALRMASSKQHASRVRGGLGRIGDHAPVRCREMSNLKRFS